MADKELAAETLRCFRPCNISEVNSERGADRRLPAIFGSERGTETDERFHAVSIYAESQGTRMRCATREMEDGSGTCILRGLWARPGRQSVLDGLVSSTDPTGTGRPPSKTA